MNFFVEYNATSAMMQSGGGVAAEKLLHMSSRNEKKETDASLYAGEQCRHTEKMYLHGDQSSALRVSAYAGTAAFRRTKQVMKHEAISKWMSQRPSKIEVGAHRPDE